VYGCSLEARADMNCKAQAQWSETRWSRIKDGINYLRKVKDQTNIRSRTCSRVSCSWDTAFWLCNDVSGPAFPWAVWSAPRVN